MLLCPFRIAVSSFFPFVVAVKELSVNVLFRFQPCLYSIIEVVIHSQIDPPPLEADADSVSSVLSLIYAAESTFVVPPLFSLLQELDASAVYPVKPVLDLILVFFSQASATFAGAVYQV